MSEEKNYVVVVGGCNMDIQGKTANDPISNDSNPGTIRLSPGGVGRNIAENLARLQISTKLLSVLGDDANGHSILKDSKDAGIDMKHCLVLKNRTTSTYLSILNPQGGLEIALSDMSILEEMTNQVLDKNSQLIENSKLLVLDTNLPQSFLESIPIRFPNLPIYLDPVSGRKIGKIKGILDNIHLLKPNRLETEQLTGFEINKRSDLIKAASWILDQGVKEVVISLGKEGVFYADENEMDQIRAPMLSIKNRTGAGDALFAGLVYGTFNKTDLRERILMGMAASILTLTQERGTSINLSGEMIEKTIKDYHLGL